MDPLILPPTFRLARYHFTLTARDPISVPPFKGSALRGGFGHAFKSMVCFQSEVKSCAACLLRYSCPYSYVFETPVPPDAEVLSKHEHIPRPLIIEPPLDRRTDYPPGEQLAFHVTLVGRAMDFLPYFLVAFQELGRQGLGRGRGRFELSRVEAVGFLDGAVELVYDKAEPAHIHARVLTANRDTVTARAEQLSPDSLTVNFATPTRLKHEGRFVRAGLPFHVLFRTLLRRLSSLSYFHCGERWETDYRGWIDRAHDVRLSNSDTRWENWSRFSGRQHQRIDMGGIVGRATYSGDLAPFRPLLALGQWIHVGKGTVFGNGQYTLDGKGAIPP